MTASVLPDSSTLHVEVEKKRLSGENVSQDVSQKVDNPSKKVEIK